MRASAGPTNSLNCRAERLSIICMRLAQNSGHERERARHLSDADIERVHYTSAARRPSVVRCSVSLITHRCASAVVATRCEYRSRPSRFIIHLLRVMQNARSVHLCRPQRRAWLMPASSPSWQMRWLNSKTLLVFALCIYEGVAQKPPRGRQNWDYALTQSERYHLSYLKWENKEWV